ncbi:Hypothetical protein NTJ_02922 [Nesidiocoris tenuis]|nr:Hypothetical protein NTJ_02922 [Nesidiocoris tenuis]
MVNGTGRKVNGTGRLVKVEAKGKSDNSDESWPHFAAVSARPFEQPPLLARPLPSRAGREWNDKERRARLLTFSRPRGIPANTIAASSPAASSAAPAAASFPGFGPVFVICPAVFPCQQSPVPGNLGPCPPARLSTAAVPPGGAGRSFGFV